MRIHISQYVDVDLDDLLEPITTAEDLKKAIATLHARLCKTDMPKLLAGTVDENMSEQERSRIDLQSWVRMADQQGLAKSMTLRARDYLASMGVVV